MSMAVPNVKRGCGTRVEGGVYLECGTGSGPGARPLEWFLLDPPKPFEVDHKVGVELVEGPDGKTHVLDWVGQAHYPHVADFLEEGRRYGFSRRVSRGTDFSRLELGSRILVVHAQGLLENVRELRPYLPESLDIHYDGPAEEHHCGVLARTGDRLHFEPFRADPCTRLWWAFAPASEASEEAGGWVRYFRRFNDLRYEVHPVQPHAPKPQWRAAIVASLPITNVSVIRARDGSHAPVLREVSKLLMGKDGYRINVSEADG